MKNKYLIVVDMQNDFISGALGTAEAEAILPNAVKKAREFSATVIFTKDTHDENYLNTQEGKFLPVKHCIKGTRGWQLAAELQEIQEQKNCLVIEKPVFGSVALAQILLEEYQKDRLGSAELIGLCTDICVISNALLIKSYMPELPVTVDTACCAGVSPDKHNAALKTMESCQIILK